MLKYFNEKNKNQRKINRRLKKYKHKLKKILKDLEEISNWPKEDLLFAREYQYQIFKKLANFKLDWYIYIKDRYARDIYFYSTCKNQYVSYITKDGLWNNIKTSELNKYSYPSNDAKIIKEVNGITSEGYFMRVSADWYIKKELKKWSGILNKVLKQ